MGVASRDRGRSNGRTRRARLGRAATVAALTALILAVPLAGAAAGPPKVDSLTPAKGSVDGGYAVEIAGGGFEPGTPTVLFGSVPAPWAERINVSHVIAGVPAHPAGKALVSVNGSGPIECKPNGHKCKTNEFLYTGLTITEVIPNHGPLAGATTVRLVGDGFAPGSTETKIQFGKNGSGSVECVSMTECVAVTPAQAKHGAEAVLAAVGVAKMSRKSAPVFNYEP